jgi:ketopantoate reductase
MRIGFIGLGIMGSRMATNLQKQGHSLLVFNRTRSKESRCLVPVENLPLRRRNLPVKWMCSSPCSPFPTQSNKPRSAWMDF